MFGFLKKRDRVATIQPAGLSLTVTGGEKLLNAALAAGLDWPHNCRVGSCGTCRCYLKSGRIKPLTDFTYTLEGDELRRGAILACQSLLRTDVVVEIELGTGRAAAVEHHAGTIARTARLTHDILAVDVAFDAPAFREARAGQYAEWSAGGIEPPRSYSFARMPEAGGSTTVSFVIRHVPGGTMTDWLFAADRTGEPVRLSGPYGQFYRRSGAGRMICVAGGSGLAPIYAIVEEALAAGVTRDCVVLFGARARRDLYFLDELAEMGRRWPGRFELIPVLSEEPPDSGWKGERGLVTEALDGIAARAPLAAGDEGYLCGPPPMVDAGIVKLRALGMAEDQIFFDRFLDASTQPGGRAAI